jgi:sulfide:quinone oxidoreductase
MAESHKRVLIIGGGTAGITTAAHLIRAGAAANQIAIIEPSKKHYYQPIWTLVGGVVIRPETSVRDEATVIPHGVEWLNKGAAEIDPERQMVRTTSGDIISYDFLVVATGVELDWDGIPGLRDALATEFVSTNYSYEYAPKTWAHDRKLPRRNGAVSYAVLADQVPGCSAENHVSGGRLFP